MAGGWTNENKPKRPGFYNQIVAAAEAVVTGGSGGVVGMAGVFNWGPISTPVQVSDQRAYEAAFGPTNNAEHFGAVGAFTGTGDADDGASSLIVYRPAITGQAKAAITLQHTGAVNAVTLTAKYHGTLGNSVTVTVRENPTDSAYNQLLVYLSGTLVETYNHIKADIAGLVAQINANSDYLTATQLVGTTALAVVTGSALTGGNNGTVTSTHYATALAAFETQPVNIVFLPSMTDGTTLAMFRQWIADVNASTRRVIGVTGGGTSESMSAAITRSALSSTSGDMVNAGYAEFTDGDGTARNTADMAGYLAGMIAGAGSSRAITFARLPEAFTLTRQAVDDDVDLSLAGGVVTFTRDSAGIRVEKGLTTYTADTEAMPNDVFSRIKFVRTIHQIENDLTDVTETEWIGKVPNESASRASYKGMVLTYFGTLAAAKIIKPAFDAGFDPTQDNEGEAIYLQYTVEFTSSIEQVLAIGTVSV